MPILLAALSFLRSSLGKYVLIAAAVAAALIGGYLWHGSKIRAHDAALKAAWVADQRAAVAQDRADAYAAGQSAVAAKHAAEIAALAASAPVIQRIIEYAKSDPNTVCAPDAVAIDELRRRAGSSRGP